MRARKVWKTRYLPRIVAILKKWNQPIVYRTALGVAAAAFLLFVFSRLISLGSVFRRLEHLNPWLALLCGAVFLLAWVVRALRWRYFLMPYKMSVRDAVLIYLVSIFVNWLLPVRGGEIVKAFLARKQTGIPVREALPTVAMDKLMDLLPALVLLVILPFMPFHLSGVLWGGLLLVAGVFLLAIVFLVVCVWKRELALGLLNRVFKILPATLRQKVEPFAEDFVTTLLRLAAQPRLLMIAAAYTAVAVGFDALFAWLAFLTIGALVPFTVVLFGYTLYNLAYMFPTPPGQIGSNEVIGLAVFSGIFGINRISVAAMFLFSHPWTAILMVAAGMVSLSILGVGLRSILFLKRKGVEDDQKSVEDVALTQGNDAPAEAADAEPEPAAMRRTDTPVDSLP